MDSLLSIVGSLAKHFVRVLPISVLAALGWVLWHAKWFFGLPSMQQAVWGAFLLSAAIVASLAVEWLFHKAVAFFSRWRASRHDAFERMGQFTSLMSIDQKSYDLLCELVAYNSFSPSFTIYEDQLSSEAHLMLRAMAADGLVKIRQSGYISKPGAMFSVTLTDHIFQQILASMRGVDSLRG